MLQSFQGGLQTRACFVISFPEITSSSFLNISSGKICCLKGKKKDRAGLPSLRRSTTKVKPVVRGCRTYSYFLSPFFSANSWLRALVLAEERRRSTTLCHWACRAWIKWNDYTTGTAQQQLTQYRCRGRHKCAFSWPYHGMRKSHVDCKKSLFTLPFNFSK